jgi:hypothetical protein
MEANETLYIYKFDRDDMEGMCWIEYVVSTSLDISSEWRHNPSENETVIDWEETSDIEYRYPNATKMW